MANNLPTITEVKNLEKLLIPSALVGFEVIIKKLGATGLVDYLSPYM